MSRVKKLALILLSPATGAAAFASEAHGGVSTSAEKLFDLGPLPVTNSMVTSWVVAVALIIVIRFAIKRPKLVPSRGQAMVESLIEGIYDLIAPIVGNKVAKPAFPLLIGIFTFILIQNWSGLLPGVGTLYLTDHKTGEWMEMVRPANADLNGTAAIAIVAILGWFYFIMRYAGPALVLKDIFGNKADQKEVPSVIYYPLFVIFFLVGIIEVISIAFRPISLSLRLFGNVFGGESLMHAMSGMQKWGLPAPFYFLELLIGFVQAFVFTLLVSVYIGLICNHGDDHEHAHEGHKEAAH
ncbi:MAG TPA: F0F1 ATP synthase subunit A [Opitutaceae bacterium]|nr:F0F1 ATP synthase subunit A [Opitutaceae bacterium]